MSKKYNSCNILIAMRIVVKTAGHYLLWLFFFDEGTP